MYCIGVVRRMFQGSFGTQISMVMFIFNLVLRKGQCRVKLGRKRSNFQIHDFLSKICLSRPVLLRIPKMSNIFTHDNYKCKKLRLKVRSSHLHVCFYHCTAKNKDIPLKFGMRGVCMQLLNIYSSFLDKFKILDFFFF